ncbi:MAG: VWA domain-containing protein [Bdellovibrionales bacterium]|nr:VWA domain-containing protein [Bdellovibrionales bacterium]
MPFGLLYPLSLLLLPLGLGALFWAYRRHGKGQKIVVSSTLLFEVLREKASFRKKFRPPLRFFLEVLLLIILVLGASGLYENESHESVALILDNSLSMSAQSFRGGVVRSRFDRAKEQAVSLLHDLPSGTRVTLFIVSPQLIQVGTRERSVGEAEDALDDLSVGYLSDNLQGVLSQFSYQPEYGRVYVVSDKQPIWEEGDAASSTFSFRSLEDQSVVQDNLALSHIRYVQDSQSKEGTLFVSISLYGNEEKTGKLELLRYVDTGASWKTSLARSASFSVGPGETKEISFKNLSLESPYKLEMNSFARQGGEAWEDPLPRDNVAWIAEREAQDSLIVVGKRTVSDLGLALLDHIRWQHVSESEYVQNTFNETPAAFLFDRYMPAVLPDTNALFVLPEGQGVPIVSKAFVRDAELSSWDATNPLLSYVKFSALRLNGAYVLEGPEWMNRPLSVEEGPIVLSGESGGNRYVAFGFDLFPFVGKRDPVLSIFTLNTLRWLVPSSHPSLSLDAGELLPVFRLGATLKGLDRSPASREIPSGVRERVVVPDLYIIQEDKGPSHFFGVNFFNAEESNIGERREVVVPQRKVFIEPQAPSILSDLLARLALALLLLDLIFFSILPLYRSKRGRILSPTEVGGAT